MLTLTEIYILQESIVKECDSMLKAKNTNSEGLTATKVESFYGFNSGTNDPESINQLVYNTIKDSFPFKKHRFRKKGNSNEWIFNGKKLYLAIKEYNKLVTDINAEQIFRSHQTIKFSDSYLAAYLHFLGKENIKDLTKNFLPSVIQNFIAHTKSTKPKKIIKNRKTMSGRDKTFTTLDKELSSSTWHLFSYNPYRGGIVQAVVNIGQLMSETMTAPSELFNPHEHGFFNHEGKVDVSYAKSGLMIFDFEPRLQYKSHLTIY